MDGNMILLIIFWVLTNALMYRIGYTQAFEDAAGVIAEKILNAPSLPADSGDAVYWRKMYEEEVNASRETAE